MMGRFRTRMVGMPFNTAHEPNSRDGPRLLEDNIQTTFGSTRMYGDDPGGSIVRALKLRAYIPSAHAPRD
jgi:hypothetical protein